MSSNTEGIEGKFGFPTGDDDYKEYILEAVHENSIEFNGGSNLYLENAPKVAAAGDHIRLYGDSGWGGEVRGLFINGMCVYYNTREEREEQRKQARADADREEREDYERNRDSYMEQVEKLPEPFKARILGFLKAKEDWGRRFLKYELFVCQEAVKIAALAGTASEVNRIYDIPWEEQKSLGISEGHSGNTFGVACRLATFYLQDPDLVPIAHGALCPLVGCEEYGCHAVRVKGEKFND